LYNKSEARAMFPGTDSARKKTATEDTSSVAAKGKTQNDQMNMLMDMQCE